MGHGDAEQDEADDAKDQGDGNEDEKIKDQIGIGGTLSEPAAGDLDGWAERVPAHEGGGEAITLGEGEDHRSGIHEERA